MQEPLSAKKILIVEDDPDVAELLGTFFERAGLPASIALSVKEANQRLEEMTFAVILADVHVGAGTGFELLERLSAKGLGTPLFLVTGDPEISEVNAIKAGAAGLFYKPFKFSIVVQCVLNAANAQAVDSKLHNRRDAAG